MPSMRATKTAAVTNYDHHRRTIPLSYLPIVRTSTRRVGIWRPRLRLLRSSGAQPLRHSRRSPTNAGGSTSRTPASTASSDNSGIFTRSPDKSGHSSKPPIHSTQTSTGTAMDHQLIVELSDQVAHRVDRLTEIDVKLKRHSRESQNPEGQGRRVAYASGRISEGQRGSNPDS